MENILLILNIILAAILVVLVLLQKSEGGALGISIVRMSPEEAQNVPSQQAKSFGLATIYK